MMVKKILTILIITSIQKCWTCIPKTILNEEVRLSTVFENEEERPSTTATVVISSNGGAAQHVGGALGQFDYDQDKGCYVQKTNISKICEFLQGENCLGPRPEYLEKLAVYLYSDEDDRWHVNNLTGEKAGWLYNPIPSKILPSSGWMYSDGKSWQSDVTLSVTPGPLILPSQFTVTASGDLAEMMWFACLGDFNKTDMWWRGRPMYFNFNDNKDCDLLLHHGPGDYGWVIGPMPGIFAILRGSRAHHSPTDECSWKYIDESNKNNPEWKPALVNVTGSDELELI